MVKARRALLLSALLLSLLTSCGWQKAALPDASAEAGQAVQGTVMYDDGNTVRTRRMSDYYVDSSKNIYVFVDYPDYYQADGDDIAELIRQTAYNGWTLQSLTEYPNTTITVDYEVTRNDARYFSVAFRFCAIIQGSAHPSSSEYAITIDRSSGRSVQLSDILDFDGPNDLAQLIPEVFTALGNWFDLPALEELASQYTDSNAFDEDKNFYLTEDSLCLIVSDGRYTYVLEAPLSSLPLLPES